MLGPIIGILSATRGVKAVQKISTLLHDAGVLLTGQNDAPFAIKVKDAGSLAYGVTPASVIVPVKDAGMGLAYGIASAPVIVSVKDAGMGLIYGMSALQLGINVKSNFIAVTTDPYFGDVGLLIHGNGANGSTAIIDSSNNTMAGYPMGPTTITAHGTAAITTSTSKWNGSSVSVGGSGNYISLTNGGSIGLDSGWDFTVEWWAEPLSEVGVFCGTVNSNVGVYGWQILLGTNYNGTPGEYFVEWQGSGGGITQTCSQSQVATGFAHFAIVSYNHVITCYINGVGGTPLTANPIGGSSSNVLEFGQDQVTGLGALVDFNDFRLTRQVARYTSDFTPPTASFPNA